MTLKIIPPLILKTIKEFKNVYMENGIGNQNNIRSAYNTGHNNPPNIKSNETKTTRTWELLPITLSIIPVIFAIQCKPEKPPLMRYTDLPLYDAPHYIYKESQVQRDKCPRFGQKVSHGLKPYVACYRRCVTETFENLFNYAECQVLATINAFILHKEKFLCYMRDGENLYLRLMVVALGNAAGFVFGSRNYYLPPGILAALFTGWLCFPEKTDKLVRHISYYVIKNIVDCLNYFFGDQCQKIPFERRSPLMPRLKGCFEPTYSEYKACLSPCKFHGRIREISQEHLKEDQNANDKNEFIP